METKKCLKCGRELSLDCFSKDASRKDGLQTQCKECRKEISKLYRKTIKGRSTVLRNTYISSDKKYGRIGDCLPDDYVTVDFIMSIIQQPCAHCGKSGFEKIGLNRLDNTKPHTISNCEPCCEDCNLDLASEEFKEKYLNRNDISKPVSQIDIETNKIISVYPSQQEASRQIGCNQAHISDCCRGMRNKAGGYGWSWN